MIIIHADKNTLPQQVQENFENILTLAGKIKDIYTTTEELTSDTTSIDISATTINTSTFDTGWLLDVVGNLFNIETISDGIAYIYFMANVKGPTGATGATGAQGERGEQGEQGEQGEAGEAATITIGTTTTLDAGSSATVTNTGTTTNAILNFGIPKGENGESGANIADIKFNDIDKVTYADKTAVIVGNFAITDANGNITDASGTLALPIEAGENIIIDANSTDDGLIISSEGGSGGAMYLHSILYQIIDSGGQGAIQQKINIICSESDAIASNITTGTALIDLIVKYFGIQTGLSTSSPLNGVDQMVDCTSIDVYVVKSYFAYNEYVSSSTTRISYTFGYRYLSVSSGTATSTLNTITGEYSDFASDAVTIQGESIVEL